MSDTKTYEIVRVRPHARRRTKKQGYLLTLAKMKFHIIAFAIFMFILPIFFKTIQSQTVLLAVIHPVLMMIAGVMYGYRYGYDKRYVIIPLAFFLISTFFFYEKFAFLYLLCYFLVMFVALIVGTIARNNQM